jgi:hypothetical protein
MRHHRKHSRKHRRHRRLSGLGKIGKNINLMDSAMAAAGGVGIGMAADKLGGMFSSITKGNQKMSDGLVLAATIAGEAFLPSAGKISLRPLWHGAQGVAAYHLAGAFLSPSAATAVQDVAVSGTDYMGATPGESMGATPGESIGAADAMEGYPGQLGEVDGYFTTDYPGVV